MPENQKIPIIFIIGLSGAGKSFLGQYLKDSLNFLHIEQDTSEGDIIDILGIRSEWEEYMKDNVALKTGDSLRKLATQEAKDGVVMTFSSIIRLSPQKIKAGEEAGIITRIMFGSRRDCLDSYLERERQTGRGYTKERWILNNSKTYELYSGVEYESYRLIAFSSGKHKPIADLVKELKIT